MLSRFLLLQWMLALSLWKVVCRFDYVTQMDGRLVTTEGSLLFIFLLLQWMLALSLWKVVCRCDLSHSNGC